MTNKHAQLIVARLPRRTGLSPQIDAGTGIITNRHGDITVYLYGLPYFREGWVNSQNIAQRWAEDHHRVLAQLDGTFLLLVLDSDRFYLVNDKISPLCHFLAHVIQHFQHAIRLLFTLGQEQVCFFWLTLCQIQIM